MVTKKNKNTMGGGNSSSPRAFPIWGRRNGIE